MLYLGYEKSNLVWYLILMGGFGFFISPGVTIITAVDIGTLTEGNPRLRKQVFFFEAMSRQVVMMIFNILVGWLLDKGKCVSI